MKKIFTLLFTTALLSTAFAQPGQRNKGNDKSHDIYVAGNDQGYGHDDRGKHGIYFFSPRERDMEIAHINRDYSYKIQSVRNEFFMSRFQKGRLIRKLEAQRDTEIHAVVHKFYDERNQFGDYGKANKKYKKNRW